LLNGVQMRRAWLAVGAVYLVDALWSGMLGLTLAQYAAFLGAMAWLLSMTVVLRVFHPGSRFAAAAEVVALWLAFAHCNNLLSYLAATPGLKLQDELFARLDRILGFDWLALFAFVQADPIVENVLSVCYGSLLPEVFALGVFLAWTWRDERVQELFWIAFLSSLLTSVISWSIPALGAFQQYGMPAKEALQLHNLQLLRSGIGLRLALPDMNGIVTFPSYHATLALLMAYVMRGTGAIFYGVALWNLTMVVATIPIGGHYLVDLIGGAGVLLIAIAAFNRVRRLPAHDGGDGRAL
jgi:membrane-associated phospholipid phosphatase